MVSMLSRLTGTFAAAVMLAACSTPPSAAEKAADAERASMAPLKAAYPDVVMGFDVHGSAVDVSIDLNGMVSMDEDAEAAMKTQAVKQWRTAWLASHPHQHAMLTLRFIDFKGRADFTQTTKA